MVGNLSHSESGAPCTAPAVVAVIPAVSAAPAALAASAALAAPAAAVAADCAAVAQGAGGWPAGSEVRDGPLASAERHTETGHHNTLCFRATRGHTSLLL